MSVSNYKFDLPNIFTSNIERTANERKMIRDAIDPMKYSCLMSRIRFSSALSADSCASAFFSYVCDMFREISMRNKWIFVVTII